METFLDIQKSNDKYIQKNADLEFKLGNGGFEILGDYSYHNNINKLNINCAFSYFVGYVEQNAKTTNVFKLYDLL